MDLVFVGKIVNTHGIKGELRIVSDFEKKEIVFKSGNRIIIDNEEHVIRTYRKHKVFDMITIDEIDDINEVLKYVGKNVYVSRDSLKLKEDEFLFSDLIGLNIINNDTVYGIVSDYQLGSNPLIKVKYDKDYYIPINNEFIKRVDLKLKKIIVDNIEGLL